MYYRKGQKEIMDYKGGYLAVPSVPGAGKTFVLAKLAAKLINENRNSRILILTVMNSAASNFKNRIAKFLKEDYQISASREYDVMTIHSFCKMIVDFSPGVVHLPDDYLIASEHDKREMVNKAVFRYINSNEKVFYSVIDENQVTKGKIDKSRERWKEQFSRMVSSAISYFKSMGKSYEEMASNLTEDDIFSWSVKIYGIYENLLKKNEMIDFDDLLRYAKIAFTKNKACLQYFKNQYEFVFEDEAQDSSFIQQEIITKLVSDKGNYIRVGDPNQSIMGTFTTSTVQLFNDFINSPDVTKIEINQTNRNSIQIIDLANEFLKKTKDSKYEIVKDALTKQIILPVDKNDPIKNPNTQGYPIGTKLFTDSDEEFDFIKKYSISSKEKYPDKTIAILCPDNYSVKQYADQFEKEKIEFVFVSGINYESLKTMKRLSDIISYIANPHSSKKLVEALKSFLDEKNEKYDIILDIIKNNFTEEFIYGNNLFGLIEECEEKKQIIKIRDKIKRLIDTDFVNYESMIIELGYLLDFDRELMAICQRISKEIRIMYMETNEFSLNYLATELRNSQNRLSYFASVVYENSGFDPEKNKGKIILSTMHKSKGLEFDIVFITALTSGNYPATPKDKFMGEEYYLKDEYKNPSYFIKGKFKIKYGMEMISDFSKEARKELTQERIRLLYVGITRAREMLFFTAHKKRNFENFQFYTGPSLLYRYIDEILK